MSEQINHPCVTKCAKPISSVFQAIRSVGPCCFKFALRWPLVISILSLEENIPKYFRSVSNDLSNALSRFPLGARRSEIEVFFNYLPPSGSRKFISKSGCRLLYGRNWSGPKIEPCGIPILPCLTLYILLHSTRYCGVGLVDKRWWSQTRTQKIHVSLISHWNRIINRRS